MPIVKLNNEPELLKRIADGDEKAFEQIFTLFIPHVSQIIYRIVPSETELKDIIQEVFLRIWLTRDKLSDMDRPDLYIYRITYNCAFQHIKKQKLQKRTQAEFIQTLPNDALQTQENVLLRETEQLIAKAIRQLPDQSRKIYELNRVSGLKPDEIAGQLGINVQSVRNSLSRSVSQIRELLTKEGFIIPAVLFLCDFF